MGLSRILSFLFFIVISGAISGFVEDNQNIFHEQYQSAPISYQSFVNIDKFSSSDRNSFDVQHSSKAEPVSHQSKSLFKAADYAEKAAYNEEVENAHRAALANRHNDTDAAYVEAYTEALQAQRKADGPSTDVVKSSYVPSYLQHQRQIDQFNPEYSNSRLLSHSAAKSKSDYNVYQNRYEDVGNKDYNVNYNDGDNYEFRKSVEYVVPSGYEFNANNVVHQQPEVVSEKKIEIQFAPALDTFDSSLRHQ